jgi:CRISPR-associated endonuclease/helicase Cas3
LNSDYIRHFNRFAALPEGAAPHPWQVGLAEDVRFANRLIRIPTGFGKTYGVLGAWLWNRVEQGSDDWPRRLVWCLPMRVLVEQVVAEIQTALARLGGTASKIGVHALMGGIESGEWHIAPERESVLIGTQDMLLSRAMNRGYGAARARWPMDFGLLNQDCLWVMDEVQLMDVGLATSAQLQAFREQDDAKDKTLRPCKTWWMSATLQESWLHTSPDTQEPLRDLPHMRIAAAQRVGALWDDDKVRKPLAVESVSSAKKLAAVVAKAHQEAGRGAAGPTLVVVNRVDQAVQVFGALQDEAKKSLKGTDLRLVHSRFRPAERATWREAFLNRSACAAGTDRIVVATQVVEAGVDISAAVLVTELAPWPSLVQRFGRCARWGGTAKVIVADSQAKDDKAAAPYTRDELNAARDALSMLPDVAPKHLETFEEVHPELLPRLYPYEPAHLLMRNELDELFDTASDLSGADIDISRFIRSGAERDLHVFWRIVDKAAKQPDATVRAMRDELCAVPFQKARDWLCPNGRPATRAWVWDWLKGEWRRAEPRQLYPGQTVLVATEVGGYDPTQGWAADRRTAVMPVPLAAIGDAQAIDAASQADSTEDDESLSLISGWQTIAYHGEQVGRQAAALASTLAPALSGLFDLAGRWHDVGKAHPAFQGCLKVHPYGQQIAKAPKATNGQEHWYRGNQLYRMPDGTPARRGFRHELASTLALLALLRRCHPDHPALLGPWRDLLARLPGAEALPPSSTTGAEGALTPLEREVLALDSDQVDLLLYLVCSHHGKVRMSWHASPADQSSHDTALRIRGVRAGDVLPALSLADAHGGRHTLPEAELVLAPAAVGLNPHTGRGWTERVLGLLERQGPFTLAWLEALMRAADQRATRDTTLADPTLHADNVNHGLERSDSSVAGAAGGGETPPPLGEHSAQRGAQLRLRGRAGGSGDLGGRTRPPAHATRYVETQLGTLSYLELAPHLASAARGVESEIEAGVFDERPIDDQLIAELHRRLCADLTPRFVGWRLQPVVVGTHTPPEPHRVPLLMREYALDLQARLDASSGDDPLLEALAFAEGRLLSIHPFTDFNGRATRLFLRLLLRRLDLPDVDLLPDAGGPEPYFLALRAGDQRNWQPLCDVWRQRFEQGEAQS